VSVSTSSDNDFWRDLRNTMAAMLGDQPGRGVTINAGAGMIVVRATPLEMRQVADYLRAVQVSVERQVMLEAKIIEVQLNKSAESGVNWSLFRGISRGNVKGGYVGLAPGIELSNVSGGNLANGDVTVNPGTGALTEALGQGFYGLAVQGASFAALLSFLESQGNVQVLSSPRIATLNNQKAVLKVGSDERFVVGLQSTSVSGSSVQSNGTVQTTSSPLPDIQPFFSGISLDITPQIDDTGVVILHVHPAVSTVTDRQKVIDMGELGTLRLPLAVSTINETDSIVRVMNGQIVAIGGLMSEGSTSGRSGVPGLSDVPAVGGLFSYKTKTSTKRELVILIKPTVISDEGVGWDRNEPEHTLGLARK
jgi:MSHA biogenesis protein MshL